MNKDTIAILNNRAIEMAQESVQKREVSSITKVITFTLASETYGVESVFVREVYPLKDFTTLPGVPAYIFGIINVRGQILPVVDLKKLFKLPEKGLNELNRVIILFNNQMEFGILADEVHCIQEIENEDIQIVPPNVSLIGEEFMMGITKENLIILNAVKLLSDKSMIVNINVA
jgi:purine-binding chemotaxis protein CheW